MNKFTSRQLALVTALSTLLVLGLIGCGGFAPPTEANRTPNVPQPQQPESTVLEARNGATMIPDAAPYSISVNGSGVASITPDIVDIQLGLETIDNNAQQAITQNTEQMTAIMAAIRQLGVEGNDIQTTVYNVWIEQVYNPDDGRPTGELRYHVINIVTVRLREVARTGELLQVVSEAGANRIDNITFGVADPSALQSQARERAVADAKAKAEQLANALGVKVGTVHQISEYTSGPSPVYAAAREGLGGGGEVPISSGSYNVTIEVQVVFDIQR